MRSCPALSRFQQQFRRKAPDFDTWRTFQLFTAAIGKPRTTEEDIAMGNTSGVLRKMTDSDYSMTMCTCL